MTTYILRTLVIENQYNPISDNFTLVSARTTTARVALLGDENFLPYQIIGSTPDGDTEIEVDENFLGSVLVDGQEIDRLETSEEFFQGIVWPSAAGPQSTTILVVTFEDVAIGLDTTYVFAIGGTPLPEFANASEFQAFEESIISFGPPIHDPGPGNTIDMDSVPLVVISEDDFIIVPDFPGLLANIPGGGGSDTIDFTDAIETYAYLDYAGLTLGPINVTLDGTAETGSIVKQGVGTDSFVNLGTGLQAGWISSGGLAVAGTNQNDTFTASVNEDWIEFVGGGGNDTFNLDLTNMGIVRLTYERHDGQNAASGITVNLTTGVVSNDGFGGADQINTTTGAGRLEINATALTDTITGSGANERFILLGGNDTLDAGGGFDLVRYDRSGVTAVNVNLATGTATGSHQGLAFTHTLSNVESIRGSRNGDDTLIGNGLDNQITAYAGDDILRGGGGNDTLYGGSGSDTVIINANSTDATFAQEGGGWRITTSDGADLVGFDVESFQFNNATLSATDIQSLSSQSNDLIIMVEDTVNGDQRFASGGNDTYDFVNIVDGFSVIYYNQITTGPILVEIDATTNTGTIAKTGFGIDTLVNVNNALESGFFSTGGLTIFGTAFGDTFDVTVDDSWIGLFGGAGNDTYNLDLTNAGIVRIDFRSSANEAALTGINANLATGIVSNDGYGGADVINVLADGAGRLELGGTALADIMIGSDRNDRFLTLGGNDTVDGGEGVDTVRYDRPGLGAVNVNLDTGVATGTYFGVTFTQSLTSIEAIRGSRDGNDTITGNGADNILGGMGGDDQIFGGTGNDSLYGWEGNDSLYGGAGDDLLEGNEGFDLMDGGAGSDTYIVDGLDTVTDTGTSGTDRAEIRNAGGDVLGLNGWSGIERVVGFTGNDVILGTGYATALTIEGGAGDDLIYGTNNNDTLFGGVGNDEIYGENGNDQLLGGDGVDTLFGGDGNDTLIGGAGADVMDGNEGSDVYMIEAGDIITDTGSTGSDRAQISAAGGLSIAVGSWTGVERINGFTGNDTIDATGANAGQTIQGFAGNDSIIGGNARDNLFGGDGDDVMLGGGGNDQLSGGTGVDTLYGGAGNDTLFGNQGADVQDGGEGSDTYMIEGADVINDTGTGASDFDRAQISAPGGMAIAVGGWTGVERVSGFIGNDTIDASGNGAAFSLQGADGNDRLIGGNGNDTIFGGNGDDAIFGGNGNDLLLGGPGVDSIFGGAGNDTLIGNQSGDFLDGGDGSDVYMLEGADVINDTGTTGADRAQISAAGGLAIAVGGWTGVERINGFIGNDTIDATGATAAQTLDGSAGDDLLIGGTGNDTLFGGNGADRLIGGAGRDFLVGGAGADDFVFATGSGSDVIRDFVRGTDQIDLRNHAVMDSFADLTITQWTNYAVIRATGTTDEILLFDGNASALTAEDFIFA